MRRLVIRPGAVGDVIVSLPAIESLREVALTGLPVDSCRPLRQRRNAALPRPLGAPFLEVWTPARTVPLVRFADRVRSIASTGLDLLGVTDPPSHLLHELRSFDSIVSWYGANRPEFRDTVAALRLPFTFLPALPSQGTGIHATDFYLDQVNSIAACAHDGIPRVQLDMAIRRENFAVIHPFSGSPRKNWPLAKFQSLAARLERVMPVRWCAGEDDPPLPGAVRIDNLFELARWLAGARLFIGNDSGIAHLAAAVGTPVLAIFGPTDPVVWAPRGIHVRVVQAIMKDKE